MSRNLCATRLKTNYANPFNVWNFVSMRIHTNVIKCDQRSMHGKVAQNLYRCVKVYEGNKALMTVSASGVLYIQPTTVLL